MNSLYKESLSSGVDSVEEPDEGGDVDFGEEGIGGEYFEERYFGGVGGLGGETEPDLVDEILSSLSFLLRGGDEAPKV